MELIGTGGEVGGVFLNSKEDDIGRDRGCEQFSLFVRAKGMSGCVRGLTRDASRKDLHID